MCLSAPRGVDIALCGVGRLVIPEERMVAGMMAIPSPLVNGSADTMTLSQVKSHCYAAVAFARSASAFACFSAALLLVATGATAEVTAVRSGLHSDRVRLVLDSTERLSPTVRVSASGRTLQVTLPGVQWGTETQGVLVPSSPFMRRYRYDGETLTVDLSGRLGAPRTFRIRPGDRPFHRFVIDLPLRQAVVRRPVGQATPEPAQAAEPPRPVPEPAASEMVAATEPPMAPTPSARPTQAISDKDEVSEDPDGSPDGGTRPETDRAETPPDWAGGAPGTLDTAAPESSGTPEPVENEATGAAVENAEPVTTASAPITEEPTEAEPPETVEALLGQDEAVATTPVPSKSLPAGPEATTESALSESAEMDSQGGESLSDRPAPPQAASLPPPEAVVEDETIAADPEAQQAEEGAPDGTGGDPLGADPATVTDVDDMIARADAALALANAATDEEVAAGHFQTARRWLERAASDGHPAAAFNLGQMHRLGLGAQADLPEAARWYRLGAVSGFAPAQLNLGIMELAGMGVPRDEVSGRDWIEKAADQGNGQAQRILDQLNQGATVR